MGIGHLLLGVTCTACSWIWASLSCAEQISGIKLYFSPGLVESYSGLVVLCQTSFSFKVWWLFEIQPEVPDACEVGSLLQHYHAHCIGKHTGVSSVLNSPCTVAEWNGVRGMNILPRKGLEPNKGLHVCELVPGCIYAKTLLALHRVNSVLQNVIWKTHYLCGGKTVGMGLGQIPYCSPTSTIRDVDRSFYLLPSSMESVARQDLVAVPWRQEFGSLCTSAGGSDGDLSVLLLYCRYNIWCLHGHGEMLKHFAVYVSSRISACRR